jgi:hypothetical protein
MTIQFWSKISVVRSAEIAQQPQIKHDKWLFSTGLVFSDMLNESEIYFSSDIDVLRGGGGMEKPLHLLLSQIKVQKLLHSSIFLFFIFL